jgi:hypothetical protein
MTAGSGPPTLGTEPWPLAGFAGLAGCSGRMIAGSGPAPTLPTAPMDAGGLAGLGGYSGRMLLDMVRCFLGCDTSVSDVSVYSKEATESFDVSVA